MITYTIVILIITIHTHLEGAHEGFVDGHHAASVVKLSAVVRRRKQGHLSNKCSYINKFGTKSQSHQLTLCEKLITVFYHLEQKGLHSMNYSQHHCT